MAVYNNALPTLCFLSITFQISPTGKFTSGLTIEGMNVQEYMESAWMIQALLEVVATFWTFMILVREGRQMMQLVREKGTMSGVSSYLSDAWNCLDLLAAVGFFLAMILWISLVVDGSRNIDLDTVEFVDLEATAETFRLFNLIFNLIILLTLISMLQYTALDDRVALLTRAVGASLGDLMPFMFIFTLFVVTFGLVGHLLYGPLLVPAARRPLPAARRPPTTAHRPLRPLPTVHHPQRTTHRTLRTAYRPPPTASTTH